MRRVPAPLLALLGVAGVLLGTVLAPPATAAACPAPQPLRSAVKHADVVFTGTVTGRRVRGAQVEYAVDVQRSYTGRVDERQTVTTGRAARACGVPHLQRGGDYLFVADRSGDHLTTSAARGTAPAGRGLVRRVERLLGQGEGPVPAEPVRATFTPVAGDPTPLTRLVAPGVALVIVGLLGLVLAGALGRRRA